MMRIWALILIVTAGSAAAAEPRELATASDAVLCLSADSLAGAGRVGQEPGSAARPRLPAQPRGRAGDAAQRSGRRGHLERAVPAAGHVRRHHAVGPAVGLHAAGRHTAEEPAGGKLARCRAREFFMGQPSKLIGSVKNRSLRPQKEQPPSQSEAENAVRTLIRWVGDDPDREGLRGTPKRVAQAYKEWFAGYDEDPSDYLQRTFEQVGGYDEMVLLRDIRFEVAL